MSLKTMLAPSTKSIQKEYVEKRQRAIYKNDPKKTEAVKNAIERLMTVNNYRGDWYDVYTMISQGLMNSELTINFDAGTWFLNENHYATYSQMYERATGPGGKMALKSSGNGNDAVTRAVADDLVTLPDEWAYAHPFSQRRRLYDALSATGSSKMISHGKLKPGAEASDIAPKLKGTDATGYNSKNKNFKPKAKQVFAALNYGARPHGSNIYYGYSQLILKPGLKEKALYYPQDTFTEAAFGKGTTGQTAYHTLGTLIAGSRFLANELWNCHVRKLSMPDTDEPMLLVEAHLFTTVQMNRDVEAMVLSRMPKKSADAQDWRAQWDTIQKNAREWCKRNNVRFVLASP
ncbi:MAG: hypothetical protein K1X57_16185 [Gemmataceae bacterium]|nr:hypothetical protein [Gemmataceae bacterium]